MIFVMVNPDSQIPFALSLLKTMQNALRQAQRERNLIWRGI